MIVQYFTGTYPWWDDNSLSKPSKTLFMDKYENATSSWVNATCEVVALDFESATLQWTNLTVNNNNTYYRIQVNGGYQYFFTDTITYDNLTTNPVQTLTLRLDKWGTCCSNLQSDFSTWDTQVLAVNKEVNLYAFWGYAYSNLSSYTFFKKVYPQHQNIQLIKYGNNQHPYYEQYINQANAGIQTNGSYYYYYKINFLVTAFNNTPEATTNTQLHGNYKDYYTTQTTYTDTQLNIITKFDDWAFQQLPFVSFSPVVTWNESNYINNDVAPVYFIVKCSFPLLLSFSTDKDIGLIQLPFCLENKGLNVTYEGNVTNNYWLTTGTAYYEAWSGGYWQLLHNDNTNANQYGTTFPTYFVLANGVNINSTFGYQSGQVNNIELDANMFSLIMKNGWNDFISEEPFSLSQRGYQISPFLIMYPYLWNFYAWNWSYMGQQVSYNISYVNNIFNLWPIINKNGMNNPNAFNIVFSANYPNLSLNFYAEDNVIGNSNTPIGQINLSTAQSPNTTNPQATVLTNESKIINNATTLKNLDIATASLNYAGGLGLQTLLNPFSAITNAINVGLDVDRINLNYSSSFGTAKQYSLAHQNTLQTAGDNLGNPDNLFTFWQSVPALNDIQTMIGDVDKYGYLYNQWDKFNNLFGNYYHNYIKLSQNADILIYKNAVLLIKSWQNYLIQQLINGTVIWSNYMPDGSVSFVDSWQLYNDCMNNKEKFWDMKNWDTNYHANFKVEYSVSNLTVFNAFSIQKPTLVKPEKVKEESKEKPKEKDKPQDANIFVWKKL